MNNKLSTPYTLYWLGGRKLEHRSGFTLIELMLSVVLFVLGTVAVVQVIALGISVDKSTEGQATALNLAQEALEACKNTSSYYSNLNTNCAASSGAVTGFSNYTRTVTVSTDVPPQVTSTVTWTYNTQTLQVSLSTLLTNNADLTSGLLGWWKFDEGGTYTNTIDASGHGYVGTLVNSPPWVTGKIDNALSFDGGTSSQRVTIPVSYSKNFIQSGTIAAWVNLTTNTGGTIISEYYVGASNNGVFSIGWYVPSSGSSTTTGTAGKLYFHPRRYHPVASSTGTVGTGAWHHIAVTWDTTQLKFYIDGALDSTTSGKFYVPADPSASVSVMLGYYAGAGGTYCFLNGKLDDVRVYNRALSANEIKRIYYMY